jgi:hypothetical protein
MTMRNPVEYAKALVKRNGKTEAVRIATNTRKTMEVAMMDPNPAHRGTPFSDEVQISEQTEVNNGKLQTKTVTFIDEAKKAARLRRTLIFWQNVTNWLAKRHPEEFKLTT